MHTSVDDMRVAAVTWLGLAGLLVSFSATAAEIDWRAPVEIARGAGERGPWQQNESRYDFVDDPTVAWSPTGELAVAWVDQRRKAVLLRRFGDDGRALSPDAVDVSRQPRTFSWLPRLAWAPDDARRLHVLWQEIVFSGGSHGGEIFHAVSRDGGRTFEAPANLSKSMPGDGKGRIDRDTWHNGSLDLVAGARGLVLAAWTEYDGRLWVARSEDGGRRFGPPRLVHGEPPARPARAPALALGRDGLVALAWTTGEDAAADIHVAMSGDGGRSFGTAKVVSVTPGYSDAPKVAFDGRGVLHLVHAERAGASTSARSSIRHLRSTDGGGSFGAATELSNPLPEGHAGAAFPSLAIDGQGRLVATWELLRPPHASPHGLGVAVSDDGVRFGPPQVVPHSVDAGGGYNGSTQGWLMRKLAVRPDGEVALVNSAVRIGAHSRVWLMRGRLR